MDTDDDLTRRTGLTAEQRSERARRAGTEAHRISNYVRRITSNVAELSDDDLAALRAIVGPVDSADVYAEGIKAGERRTLDRITALARADG